MIDAGVLSELRAICGDAHVRVDDETCLAYGTDALKKGKAADAVVFPSGPEEISRIARLCHEQRVPMVPRGAGTGYTGGFNGYGYNTPVNAPYNTGATTPFNGWSPTGFNQGFGGYANSFNPIFYGGFNPNFSNFIPNYIPNSTPNFNAGYNPIGGTLWNFGSAFPAGTSMKRKG